MSKHLRTSCALAGAVLSAIFVSVPLFSKPPDLPAADKIDCQEIRDRNNSNPSCQADRLEARDAPDSCYFGITTVVQTWCDCVLGCASDLSGELSHLWRSQGPTRDSVHSASEEEESPEVSELPGAEAESTCPFFSERARAKGQEPCAPSIESGSVVENLDRLELANRIFEMAECCYRAGQMEAARALYQEVGRLAPGSRYDTNAAEKLRALPQASEPENREVPGPEVISPCHSLPGVIGDCGSNPRSKTSDEVAADLEKWLANSEDPESTKLVLQTDGDSPGDELDGWPLSVWTAGNRQREMASLFDPEDENEDLASEESEAAATVEEEEAMSDETTSSDKPVDWGRAIAGTLAACRAGDFTEVDDAACSRLLVVDETRIGAMKLKMVADFEGIWRGMLVSWQPEMAGDLRAFQRAFNDRTTHAIEDFNASELLADDEEEELEDAGDDDDEDGDVDVSCLVTIAMQRS